jgi:RsiW-degrading membrane proteinase PrsW (M82 family)
VVIEQTVPIIRDILAGWKSEQFMPRFIAYVFGVGPLEELCKAFPLLWFGLRKNKIHGIREGLFLGLMSGLGFAAIEGVKYTFGAAASNNGSDAAFTAQILQTIFRFMSNSLLHAAWAGTVGWFIGLASTRTGARWPVVAVGIAFAAVLHGLNDVVAGGWLQLVTATVSILVFMAYLVHGEELQSAQTGLPSPATEA